MAKTDIPWNYDLEGLSEVLGSRGLLLVSLDAAGRPNAMTIGWALVGIVWRRPMCAVLVRPSRYTYDCLEATGDFTVNVPLEELDEAVSFCGSRSGRDCDKFAHCGLVAIPGRSVRSPSIEQCVMSYECAVVHKSDVVPEQLEPNIVRELYGQGDFHRVYWGEIRASYADLERWQQIQRRGTNRCPR